MLLDKLCQPINDTMKLNRATSPLALDDGWLTEEMF